MSNDADNTGAARSWRKSVLFGVAAGVVAAVAWFLVVMGTDSMQAYLLVAIGLAVAGGVHLAARHPGRKAALITVSITAVTIILGLYYVERFLVMEMFSDYGVDRHIPLVPYLDWMQSVLRHAFTRSPASAIYSLLALVVAGWFGYHGFELREAPGRQD